VVAGTSATECTAPPLDYDALAAIDTVIVLMAGENLAEVTQSLIRAGREPSTPTACVEWATTARQRTTLATLEDIVEAADRDGLESPVVAVVGDVASHATKTGLAAFGLLAGKRIVITRPRSTSGELRRAFSAAGAAVVLCPMIKIVYPPETDALDDAIRALSRYDWLAFTSVHGVRGFWRRLFALDQDARSLAGCSVAAVGSATARAIRRRGINVDLVPQPHTGVALAQALSETIRDSSVRVLYPRADIAAPVLADGLRSEGAVVDDIVAYHTVDAAPSEATLRIIREGFDAVVFCSPSAVRRFVSLELDVSGAAIACIGPSTTAAAQQVGLTVDVVPEEQTADALVAAVVGRFAAAGKAPSLPSDCSRC
jgi:uroporphyrinogen III methyltransferase/synthase